MQCPACAPEKNLIRLFVVMSIALVLAWGFLAWLHFHPTVIHYPDGTVFTISN